MKLISQYPDLEKDIKNYLDLQREECDIIKMVNLKA